MKKNIRTDKLVIREYVGRIYLEAKHRPKYEIESKILHDMR